MMDLQSIKNKFGIIGTSPVLNRALEVALRVAPTDLSVLITGESGSGKEFFPQVIHSFSSRKHSRYIAVNCGAIPEGTIDSELFGHEKGAFTGATESRKGYFEEADGGTIFLDEVAELPLTTQVRLLRVLQSGEFIRVGSSRAQKTDVRVVAATNVNLHRAIESGRFREDLYYRLNTVPIVVPALRERKGDINLLFRKFVSDVSTQYRLGSITLTAQAKRLLENYEWPGNVRQLKNVAEQISAIEQGEVIEEETLRAYLPEFNPSAMPIVHPTANSGGAGVNNATERDILYKLLFDLRGEVTELKMMMHEIAKERGGVSIQQSAPNTSQSVTTSHHNPYLPNEYIEPEVLLNDDIQPPTLTAQVIEPPKTKEEAEKRRIEEVLARHNGKRKESAAELFMSERTLYRKIKEYNIE
ncbi:MAG: sigma-54 dependent transcriptional regulator [Rikenellaceae bacterium]